MASFKKRLAVMSVSKQQRVSSAFNSSSARTNTSGIGKTCKSTSMQSAGFVSPNCKSSSLGDSEEQEEENKELGSKPNEVWLEQHTLTDIATRDLTTINLVVTDVVFPKMKFVDWDTQLMFSNEKNYYILRCNLHANISPHKWWKHPHTST
jgi:hypothetical protein